MITSAESYAQQLLRSLDLPLPSALPAPADHPAIAWADSGLMQLTGQPQGDPRMCPVPLASCADGVLAALGSLAPGNALDGLRGSHLLAERAAILGLRRAGAVSPGGACRLYAAADGRIALNLAREDDHESLAAWLELSARPEASALPDLIASRPVADLLERGRLLGLAVAVDRPVPATSSAWFTVTAEGMRRAVAPTRPPRVLELASLWAGPLCGHLLQRLGAEVIKLESPQRPDGARHGHPAFYELLNGGKRSVALDPRTTEGRQHLLGLIASADIVIEGSRPRGLRQLGIDAEGLVRSQPGLTWISITGYGRGEPREQWVAYGDDAAVAAGLSGLMHQSTGEHLICGDAIADPLTGLHAALAAWASHRSGGGKLLSLALHDVVAHCIGFDRAATPAAVRARQREWTAMAQRHGVREPRPRFSAVPARPLGADTAAMLARPGPPC